MSVGFVGDGDIISSETFPFSWNPYRSKGYSLEKVRCSGMETDIGFCATDNNIMFDANTDINCPAPNSKVAIYCQYRVSKCTVYIVREGHFQTNKGMGERAERLSFLDQNSPFLGIRFNQ